MEKVFLSLFGLFFVMVAIMFGCALSDGIKCKIETGYFDCNLKNQEKSVNLNIK